MIANARVEVPSDQAVEAWRALVEHKPQQATKLALEALRLALGSLPSFSARTIYEEDGQAMAETWTATPSPEWSMEAIRQAMPLLVAFSMPMPKPEILRRLSTMHASLAKPKSEDSDVESQFLTLVRLCEDWPADVVNHVLRPEYHKRWFPTPDVIARDLENVGGKRRALFEAVDQFASEQEAC